MIKTWLLFGWLVGRAAVPADVIGFYDVVGTGDSGATYSIVCEVRDIGGALHVRWTYAVNDHSFGHGFLRGDAFIVGFYGTMTGAAVYQRTKDGWKGEWSHDGMTYPERWTRRSGPRPDQVDEAPVGHPTVAPGQAL